MVQLEQVQFAKAEAGKTFSGEAFDEFDGNAAWFNAKTNVPFL